MKNTNPIFAVIVILTLAGLLVYEHHQNNLLRTALKRSSTQTAMPPAAPQQTSPLPDAADHARAESEHAELMRLRAAAATFNEARRELTNAHVENQKLKAALAASPASPSRAILAEGMKGVSEFQNVGLATASSAFETFLWASDKRDTNLLASAITFDEEARARADLLFQNASDTVHNHFPTVEHLIAYIMSKGTPLAGMRIFEEQPISPGKMRLQTEWQYPDGRLQPNSLTFYQSGNGAWQMVIEPAMITKLGRMLEGEEAAIRARERM